MKKNLIILFFGLTLSSVVWAQPEFLQKEMVDLTHVLNKSVPQYAELHPFTQQKISSYESGYLSYVLSMPEHIGTHVDAPNHFSPSGKSVDQLDIINLVGNAVVINIAEYSRNSDYEFTLRDLRTWESLHGPILKNSIVILRTGWESKWFQPKNYLNRDKNGVMHFPGFSCEVAEYLSQHRSVRALGTDTLSIDPGKSQDFCAHKVFLHKEKYAIEGLTNLEKLPARGAVIVVSPIKVGGGTGAPARVIAWVPY